MDNRQEQRMDQCCDTNTVPKSNDRLLAENTSLQGRLTQQQNDYAILSYKYNDLNKRYAASIQEWEMLKRKLFFIPMERVDSEGFPLSAETHSAGNIADESMRTVQFEGEVSEKNEQQWEIQPENSVGELSLSRDVTAKEGMFGEYVLCLDIGSAIVTQALNTVQFKAEIGEENKPMEKIQNDGGSLLRDVDMQHQVDGECPEYMFEEVVHTTNLKENHEETMPHEVRCITMQYECFVCKLPFANHVALKAHMKKICSLVPNQSFEENDSSINIGQIPSCQHCGRQFTKKCHSVKRRLFVCRYRHCGRTFNIKYLLEQHQLLNHKAYMCQHPGCGKSYASLNFLRRHMKSHALIQPKHSHENDTEIPQ